MTKQHGKKKHQNSLAQKKKIQVLFAVFEAVPFIKTGGLGDVGGSLPSAICKAGADMRVMLPKLESIPCEYKDRMKKIAEFSVPLSWRQQYCGIEVLREKGVTFYFIDNEYYLSLIHIFSHSWEDGEWMKRRKAESHFKKPLNIYEVHLGSWKQHGKNPEDPDFFTYRELAEELTAYVKDMGYTHVELMPVMEHPFDGSWGYQTTGYYAPTSRYGMPKDFKYLIDRLHQAGVGVILDWVPGHFCRDAHGLCKFNGSELFESEEHIEWGTYKFDYSRPQVRSFLISNAVFWLEEYHADGIRVDGVSSMLYLNYGIDDPAQKRYNEKGGEENLTAQAFLQQFNEVIGLLHPDVFTAVSYTHLVPVLMVSLEMCIR